MYKRQALYASTARFDHRDLYAGNRNITFMPAITSTSSRMHGEFLPRSQLFYRSYSNKHTYKSQAVAEGAGDTEGINGHLGIHVQQAQRVGAVLW